MTPATRWTAPTTPSLPRYDIFEPLGAGGMANVWLARRAHENRPCVVKMLHPELEQEVVPQQRFLREAEITAMMAHENIARTYDAGRTDRGFYIAMEYVPGCDLQAFAARWSEQRLALGVVGGIAAQLLDGLHYAHTLRAPDGELIGVVHRDLSPRNVMITFDGRVKLIDFGLVKARIGNLRTQPRTVSGTLRYMAPEQPLGGEVDARSDVYSAAAMLYELITGARLVRSDTLAEALMEVAYQRPKPPSEIDPTLPKALDDVLLRALEKSPDKRYATALELKHALRGAFGTCAIMGPEGLASTMQMLFPEEHRRALELEEALDDQIDELTDTLPMDGPAVAHALQTVEVLGDRDTPTATATAPLEVVTDVVRVREPLQVCGDVEEPRRRAWLTGAAVVLAAGLSTLVASWSALSW